jgi:protein-S-isoprenylcysteine O-methyltransferase Ste14
MKETAYLFQAVLVGAWWIGLALNKSFFDAFQYKGISAMAFWSFLIPDIVLISGLSTLRAYRKNTTIEYIVLGAFSYSALYCCNAMLLSQSGLLPTSLMLLGLVYNIFICFDQSFFRTSTSSRLVIVAKTLIQIVCIWFFALVVGPFVILNTFGALGWPNPGAWVNAGSLLFVCFSALGLSSAFFMVRDGDGTPLPLDQTKQLVISGPYRFVRNPMAIAGIGQCVSIAIAFQSLPILMYALLGGIIWHLVIRPTEERDLAERFGEPYLAYCERVTCWVPRFR